MAVVTMRQLLDAGVHFGHQTRRWNPKMKRFILTERNGIYIIDLQQTLTYIDRAFEFVKDTVAHGGTILFVGTKRQAQEAIAEQATRVSMPYVNQRWLGGMLTNFSTVHKRLQRLKDLEAMEASGEFAGRTKKEVLLLTREKDKLARSLGGIRDMARVPSAIWVVDTKKEHIAVGEARKLRIPVVAVLDTNCDPDEVDYPLPGNDDAIRSAALLTKVVAEAVAEGLLARSGGAAVAAGEEPLAEWERELLEAGAELEQSQAGLAIGYAEQESVPVADAAAVPGLTDAGAERAIEADAIAAAIADEPVIAAAIADEPVIAAAIADEPVIAAAIDDELAIADEPAIAAIGDSVEIQVLAETEAGAVALQQVAADAEEGIDPVVADGQESA